MVTKQPNGHLVVSAVISQQDNFNLNINCVISVWGSPVFPVGTPVSLAVQRHTGYYWLTTDSKLHVSTNRCPSCWVYADQIPLCYLL